MNLQFVNQTQTPMPIKYISVWLKYVEKQLIRKKVVKTLKGQSLSLVFLKAPKAKQLNKEYRKKDKATDVLSFSSHFRNNLGELIFCPSIVKRQAQQNQHSYRDELAYLTLHGLLHLLGFEHESGEKKARQMYEIQDSIFYGYIQGRRR